jgi:alanine racemase
MNYNHSPNTLTIDLGAISENYNSIKDITANHIKFAAMVQADAFGIGAIDVVKKLSHLGCNKFFVANIDEAIAIREHSLTDNIFVLGGIKKGEENYYYLHNITPVLNSIDEVLLWHKFAQRKNKIMHAILNYKIDKNNIGLSYDDINYLHKEKVFSILEVIHIMNKCLKNNDLSILSSNKKIFSELKEMFPKSMLSITNEIGDFIPTEYHYDMLILGSCLYGITDNNYLHDLNILQPSISLKSNISIINNNIVEIPIGYADGLYRNVNKNGYFFIADAKAPFVGEFLIDSIKIDISNISDKDIYVGAEVEIIGDNCSLSELASFFNTHPIEILISLNKGRFKKETLRYKS